MSIIETASPAPKRNRRMAREPQGPAEIASADAVSTRRQSKANQVLRLLQSPEGGTMEQLAAMTGWLPHTTRAALTGLRKKGHAVTSEKLEGRGRVYRVTV
jgi:predicted ArsR family transcriptional regulator